MKVGCLCGWRGRKGGFEEKKESTENEEEGRGEERVKNES